MLRPEPLEYSKRSTSVLSRFDDYPIHQTTDPIRIPATTDRHAYDRY
jgi:hypothetical protein